tara:strand:- start:275 stop:529 length:255 start_codon:yes stop_codon:yes gene_type:complete
MLVEHPKIPLAYEKAAECYRIQAEHLEEYILRSENEFAAVLTDAERDFVETCRQAIPPTLACSRHYMRLAALSQQMIDEGEASL